MTGEETFDIDRKNGLPGVPLLVLWTHEMGDLPSTVFRSLDNALNLLPSEEIDPVDYFDLNGVDIKRDVIQFPASRFYSCLERNFFVFKSDAPQQEYFKFLSAVLDSAVEGYHVDEVYTIGGIVTSVSYAAPRSVFGIVGKPGFQNILTEYGIQIAIDYQTPPGGGTSLNAFLVWVAQRMNLAASGLWVEMPFYLTQSQDPIAAKYILQILDARFNLGLDFAKLDHDIQKFNGALEELRKRNQDIDRYFAMMERDIPLSKEESAKMAWEVTMFLRDKFREY